MIGVRCFFSSLLLVIGEVLSRTLAGVVVSIEMVNVLIISTRL